MKKEELLQWLINFGREWVGIDRLHTVYMADKVDPYGREFLSMLDNLHDCMYITKRTKRTKSQIQHRVKGRWYEVELKTEQYRLTERAIDSLNE